MNLSRSKLHISFLKDSQSIASDYMEAYAKPQQGESIVELRSQMQNSIQNGDAIEFMRCNNLLQEETRNNEQECILSLQKILRNPELIIDNPDMVGDC